jgi:hypothetical protein
MKLFLIPGDGVMDPEILARLKANLRRELIEAERQRVQDERERRALERLEREQTIHPQELLNRRMWWERFERGPDVVFNYDPLAAYDCSVPSYVRDKR